MTKMEKENKWFLIGLLCIPFGLALFFYIIDKAEHTEIEETPIPFSAYDWHRGIVNDTIIVYDVYGKNKSDDNLRLHVREVGEEREVWLRVGNGYQTKCRVGYEDKTYSVQFSTKDCMDSYTSICTVIFNENGAVLKVNYPQHIIDLMTDNNQFNVAILCHGRLADIYEFSVIKPLNFE